MKYQEEYARMLAWCMGDQEAAAFLMMVAEISQIADDFVDRDVPECQIDSGRMLRLLHLCMVDLPQNPFFARHQLTLRPLLSASMLIWDATCDWQKSPHSDTRMFAYTWREICEQIIFVTANILGGLHHARAVIRDVHEFYHVKNQGVEDFHQWEKKEVSHG